MTHRESWKGKGHHNLTNRCNHVIQLGLCDMRTQHTPSSLLHFSKDLFLILGINAFLLSEASKGIMLIKEMVRISLLCSLTYWSHYHV